MHLSKQQGLSVILTAAFILSGLIISNAVATARLDIANTWSRGGPVVGNVNSLAIAGNNPSTIYAGIVSDSGGFGGTSNSGVYKTTDNGLNWVKSGLIGKTVFSLAVDPTNSNTAYAGTYRSGVYKSTDGGVAWSGPSLSDQDVYRLLIKPDNPSVLYASVTGNGLYKSTDGGLTWGSINNGLTFYGISGLAIDTSNTSTLYAAGGHGSTTVFKSTDGGDSWKPSSNGIPDSTDNAAAIAVSESNTSILYVGIGNDVYKSSNGGANWSLSNSGLPGSRVTCLIVDRTNPALVLAGTFSQGVFNSSDGAGTWNSTGLVAIGVNSLAFEVGNSNSIYAGTRGSGIFKSTDGAVSWNQSKSPPYGDAHELIIDPVNPAILYANTSDSVYKTIDHGASWLTTGLTNNLSVGVGFPTHKLSIDPVNPANLYAAIDFTGVFKSTNAGASWNAIYLENTNIEALAIDPANPQILYLATYPVNLFKSTDGGNTWNSKDSPGDIAVLEVDRVNSSIVYAGHNDGVSKSTDAGESWDLTALRNPGFSNPYVISLLVDPTNPSTIYAATFEGSAYRSTNGGTAWSPVFTDVLGHVLAFATDSSSADTVFAGTEQGVFRSTNGGQTSSDLSSGLPNSAKVVMALSYDPLGGYLYAGTQEGVFTLALSAPTPTPTPTPPPTYSVSGHVADSGNNPVSGVTMTFDMDFQGTPSTKTTSTDSQGNYSSGDLGCQNRVTVTPSKSGNGFSPLSISFVTSSGCLTGSATADFTATAPAPATVQFSSGSYAEIESAGSTTITVTRGGDTSSPISVDFRTNDSFDFVECNVNTGSANQRCDYIPAAGRLNFAANETSKSFDIPLIDDSYVEGSESLTFTLSNPSGASLGSPSTAVLTIIDNDSTPSPTNPIDQARFFVREHYLDFLSREPDQGGWDYWTARITDCGSDALCVHRRRIEVSAAFFIELEFQRTGYVVYRLYRAAYGTVPNGPSRANVTFAQFIADRAQLVDGPGLPQSTLDLANAFVQRPAFKQAYPDSMTPSEFVNKAFDTASLTDAAYASQRQAEIDALTNASKTRVQVLLDVIEIPEFKTREFNPAFVLMQYFGYLRRDADQGGYDFWLDVLNNHVPNNLRAMVCAFLTSAEYQQRFGTSITRTNRDCSQ